MLTELACWRQLTHFELLTILLELEVKGNLQRQPKDTIYFF